MYHAEIGKFITIFNAAAVCVAAFFAIYGVIRAIDVKTNMNRLRGGVFFQAFCLAALAAFVLESTVFNFQYYLRFFSGPELHTVDVSPDDPSFILTSDGTLAVLTVGGESDENSSKEAGGETGDGEAGSDGFAGRAFGRIDVGAENEPAADGSVKSSGRVASQNLLLTFHNLNRRVTSVYADVAFNSNEIAYTHITWRDEAGSHKYNVELFKRWPRDNYAPLQSVGKVSELAITFAPGGPGVTPIDMISVAINRPIPFYFSGTRLLAASFLIFAAIILARGKLRAKASYYLFDRKFDPRSATQNYIYAAALVPLLFLSLVSAYTSVPKSTPALQQYNVYLTDALIAGRAHLEFGNPEKLFEAARPYDGNYLHWNGYKYGVDWAGDWAWYNGKFYCYYGAVPAVMLYVPYKLITGNYLSDAAGIFLFCAAAAVLLALLWRFCVNKYMPGSTFAFCLLSYLCLFFSSGVYAILRYSRFYSIVQSAAFMFSIAGILLLLKSVENGKISRLKLFFACFCLALVVGCRPNMVFVSLLVPVVLWKYRSLKLLLFISIPYIIVAVPLCIYNYIRFDSVFEFGQKYCLTHINPNILSLSNPLSNAVRVVTSVVAYLFLPVQYALQFPYITYPPAMDRVLMGTLRYTETAAGIISFPIVIFLYRLRSVFRDNRFEARGVLAAFLAIAVIIMALSSAVAGHVGRFALDFAAFIVLPSLFCARHWLGGPDGIDGRRRRRARLKVVYVLLAVGIFTGLFLFAGGIYSHYDDALYRYLEYSLGIPG